MAGGVQLLTQFAAAGRATLVIARRNTTVLLANLDRHGSEPTFFRDLAAAGFALEAIEGYEEEARAACDGRASIPFFFFRAARSLGGAAPVAQPP